jgi:hypothetical protein
MCALILCDEDAVRLGPKSYGVSEPQTSAINRLSERLDTLKERL